MTNLGSTRLRGQLVTELERRELVRSDRVRDAFLAVPRELFVPEFAAREGLAAVYRDEVILTKTNEHREIIASARRALRDGGYRARVVHADGRDGFVAAEVHLGLRAEPSALGLYLSLTLPRGRRVTSFPTSVGAISRDGRSLALVETHPEQSGVDVMMAYGGAEAEELLLGRVRRWADRGRPGESDVRIAVTYADDRPRLTLRWP